MLLLTKGRAPVIPLAERMEIVRNLRFVDDVHAEMVPDKIDTWRQVGFDVIFKGDDWRGTPKGERLERDFAEVGVEVGTSRTRCTPRARSCARPSRPSTPRSPWAASPAPSPPDQPVPAVDHRRVAVPGGVSGSQMPLINRGSDGTTAGPDSQG